MFWQNLKNVQSTLGLNSIAISLPQSGTLFLILILFICNLSGALEFGTNTTIGISFQIDRLLDSQQPYSLFRLFAYPEFSLLLVSSILLAVLLPGVTPYLACALVVISAIPILYLGLNYPYRETPLPMQYSLLVIMVIFGVNVLINYFEDTRKKQKMVEVFGRYIPPQLADQLSKQSGLLNLKGESKELTICFCDLINFTQMAEELPPEDVVSVLNEYFTVMTEVLYEHGATIDKYMGDCVMAFWGAPVPQNDHAERAVRASIEIQNRLHELTKSFSARSLPAPDIGIGINTGVVNVGNMGSKYRLAYTVIGDAVNQAFRFEGLTRDIGAPIIVGHRTKELVDEVVFKELDTLTVRGKSKDSRVYEPICYREDLSENDKAYLAEHRSALENYYAGRFELANEQFSRFIERDVSTIYYEYMLAKSTTAFANESSNQERF